MHKSFLVLFFVNYVISTEVVQDHSSREIKNLIPAVSTKDGAGVKLMRSINGNIPSTDPFLLLDEFKSDDKSDYIAGFPSHPHRGFETVTYMIQGKMEHKDNKGNSGVIDSGSIQWMTAGKGIIHSEMPKQKDGMLWGFQLWINLPAKYKMVPPRYQDLPKSTIPVLSYKNQGTIKIIAGNSLDSNGTAVYGPVKDIVTNPLYLDVYLPPHESFTQSIPFNHTVIVYPYEGDLLIENKPVSTSVAALLGNGETVTIETSSNPTRFLLLAAGPINEPIARHGPFVMNTKEELQKAFEDYRSGTF